MVKRFLLFALAIGFTLSACVIRPNPTASPTANAQIPTPQDKITTQAPQHNIALPTQAPQIQCRVIANALHVRAWGGMDAPITDWLALGDRVEMLARWHGDNWALVSVGGGGKTGYVNSSFLDCE